MNHPSDDSSPVPPAIIVRERPSRLSSWLSGILAALSLYFFLAAINVMGAGLKALGKSGDLLKDILAHGDNPFIALMGSVIVTAAVQSSSFTTSLIITLVASGDLPMDTAVYCVMGANIGTSVTNIIAAMGNIRIRRQFRRAFTAALVHDIFNWLTVAIFFPLEWITSVLLRGSGEIEGGVLTRLSWWMSGRLGLSEIPKDDSIIKVITKPIVHVVEMACSWVPVGPGWQAGLMAIIGLIMLLGALISMVKNLKGALLQRVEALFQRVFFRNDAAAYVVGALTTILVQSSSITTSLIVPLAGAGAVRIKRVFPYTLGANLGTTVTGVIAASANPVAAAMTVAISHVSFNLLGTAIWYPLRKVPISIARWYGRLASRSRGYAFLFLGLVFLVIPGLGILITELIAWLF